MRTIRHLPPIFYGAYLLAGISLVWSGYAITDLMDSGRFGVSVALAGDIGWITIQWAEYKRRGGITLTIAGWAIALGVGVLLVMHGLDENSVPQAIAGPFVVLVGKGVGSIALYVTRDPAALTVEQEAEIHALIRDSEHEARMNVAERHRIQIQADAEIERIRQRARITTANDRAAFEIALDRIAMQQEIEHRTPIAIPSIFAITADRDHDQPREHTPINAPSISEQPTAKTRVTSTNTDRPEATIADLAREQVAIHANNPDAINAICSLRPTADRPSVGAAVRRARQQLDAAGGYR
jgi:hypothetical protein